ncbi:hypothetical protein ACPJHQ_01455 [Rossellomorea sp. H39__3]
MIKTYPTYRMTRTAPTTKLSMAKFCSINGFAFSPSVMMMIASRKKRNPRPMMDQMTNTRIRMPETPAKMVKIL